ncbi:hypothetical protein [Salipaludibacillus daqingensis]|uniref:hypothetical protein n=1 Tax=Salipaludibacillus daqingensis TaxID=3041001 RepID=UPI002476ECCD|nr:hypothetical protein [Salipaludibacillus daqingensis]
MQLEIILSIVIGIIIIGMGYLVIKKKALFLINFNSWTVFGEHQGLFAKIFGTILIIIGTVVVLLPFLLGTENINPL